MAVDGVMKAAKLLGKDLSACKVAIIGGTGDIGSGCARVLVDRVRDLTITGRTVENLKKMNTELARKRKARITATRDNHAAVKDADIVIAVAASATPILAMDWFKPGAIVCDVGYPKNISHAETSREDILVFSGGLAKSPSPIAFPIDVGLPSPDVLYGCFSEAVILSLEHRFENYSFGRGNIIPERIDEIRTIGAQHGFEVSDFYWGDRLVDQSMVERIKEKSRQ
jgi:predicted amino acid dehydrogenase